MGTLEEFEALKAKFLNIYRFKGTIRPEDTKVSFPTIHTKANVGVTPDTTTEALVEFSAADGSFEVILYSLVNQTDLLTLRNALSQLLDSVVDGIAFVEGMYLEAEFTSVERPDSSVVFFNSFLPAIKLHAQSRGASTGVGRRFPHNIEKHFRRALADFKKAMKYVGDTHFYCHRSLETLLQFYSEKHSISPEKKKQLWEVLKSDLDMGNRDLSNLTSKSKASRHGEQIFADESENVEILKLTWDVLHNFSEKRSHGE